MDEHAVEVVDGCNIGTGGGSCGVLRNSNSKHVSASSPSSATKAPSDEAHTRRRVHFEGETETVRRLYKHYVDPPASAGRLSKYWVALRPWSFSASFVPVLLGSALAFKSYGTFDLLIFLLSSFVAFCVHGAGNLVNTYYDYFKVLACMIAVCRLFVE